LLEKILKIIKFNCKANAAKSTPKRHVYMTSQDLQGWYYKHLPGQPVSGLENPFSEEIFPNTQSKLTAT